MLKTTNVVCARMHLSASAARYMSYALLVLALVLAPFGVIAHELDHQPDQHDSDGCALCLVASHMDDGTRASTLSVILYRSTQVHAFHSAYSSPVDPFGKPVARAPPAVS